MDNTIKMDVKTIIKSIDFSELNGKSILITGASGLIGTYFLYTLYMINEKGYKLSSINIVIRNELPQFLRDIVTELKANVYKGDLSDDEFVNSLPFSDYIIHAAGYG